MDDNMISPRKRQAMGLGVRRMRGGGGVTKKTGVRRMRSGGGVKKR